jgi:FG-GAP-like repeat
MRTAWVLLAALLIAFTSLAAGSPDFEKHTLTTDYLADGVTTADVNRDGHLDVIAGPYWYEGPDFKTRHPIYPTGKFDPAAGGTDCMLCFPYDFNGDGFPDVLVLGRVHLHPARWYENRGKDGLARGDLWKEHFVFERIRGESPPFVDIDADGKAELICHWDNRWGLLSPDWADPTKPWTFKPVTAAGNYNQFYHGTGVADVNGDGRLDLILNDGWFEQPPRGQAGEWPFHPFKLAEKGGAQILAIDVNSDGLPDLVSSLDAHGWGFAWFEQVRAPDGQITFKKHSIMGDRSEETKYGAAFTQLHALATADLDGDGLPDIVTGKRRWAHGPTGDIEPAAPPVVYWFQLVREPGKEPRFVPHLIDDQSGIGVQIHIADVNADGLPDVLTTSKLGVFLFINKMQKR